MTLPTIQKTWQFAVNQRIDGGTIFINCQMMKFAISQTLINFASNGWEVWGSGDGVAASGNVDNGGGTNYWLPAYTNINETSWLVLQNPATGGQLLITGTTTDGNMSISYSPNGEYGAPGSGGTGTDGTETVAPTAGDGISMLQSATYLTATVTLLNMWQSTDGACTRLTIGLNDYAHTFLAIEAVKDAPSVVESPLLIGCFNATTGTRMTYTYFYDDFIYADLVVNGDVCSVYLTGEGCESQSLGELMTFADDDTGEYLLMPIGLYVATVGHRGRKGSLYDMWYASNQVRDFVAFPGDNSGQFIKIGCFVFPWDGSVPARH